MPRFEYVEGTSAKFWEIEIDGSSVTTRWGRLGTAGQEKAKDFASPAKAQAEYDGLIREKVGKGYKEVGGGTQAEPSGELATEATTTSPLSRGRAGGRWERGTGGEAYAIAWTDALRRKLHSRRSSGVRTVPLSPKAAFARMRAHWDLHAELWKEAPQDREPSLVSALEAVRQRLGGPLDALPPPATPAVEAATFAVLSHSDRRVRQAGEVHDEVVDFWAGTSGLAGAVRFLVESLDVAPVALGIPEAVWLVRPDAGVSESWLLQAFPQSMPALAMAQGHPPAMVSALVTALASGVGRDLQARLGGFARARLEGWFRLRRLLASAEEADWDEARDEAARLRAGAPLLRRAALSYLFPDVQEWAEADVREALGMSLLPKSAGCLATCLRDADLIDRMMANNPFYILPWTFGSWDMAGVALSLIDGLGAAAVPRIVRLLVPGASTEDRRAAAEALAIVPSEEAATALAKRLDDKAVIGAAQLFAASFPRLALPAFAAQLGRGPAGRIAESLLAGIVGGDPELAKELLPSLPEPARRTVEALLARTAAPEREAGPGELPRVLANPPWMEKRTRKTPRVLALEPLPYPESTVWKPGQRERWLAIRSHWDPWIEWVAPAGRDAQVVSTILGPEASITVPEGRSDEAIRRRIQQELSAGRTLWYAYPSLLSFASPRLALALWETIPPEAWSLNQQRLERFVAQHELAALPGLLRLAQAHPAAAVELCPPFRSPRIAPMAADALVRLKAARPAAQRWLLDHAECAAVALIPLAVGPVGKARNTAAAALQFLAAQRGAEVVLAAAARYGEEAREAVGELLAFDPLDLFPAKLPKMPAFWQPAAFPRPRLRDRAALPLDAVEHLGTMLAFSRLDEPYAGIAQVKEACDPESLADFAWDLFDAWQNAGSPAKEGWAFQALGLLGDDECARRLAVLIRQWPGEGGHARAVTGLDVLRALGTDVALMHLHGIAQKVKFKGLQEKAREKIAEVAEQRGLTPEELADRLVPDLGLGQDGSMALDYGPRAFRVGFDEHLKPFVQDAAGKRLSDLPKPSKGDDPELAARAQEAWKALKKDAKTVAAQQILRLERAMCDRRRWPAEVFRPFFVEHPLVQHLARRLVWGAWAPSPLSLVLSPEPGERKEERNRQQLVATFRICEDGSFADADDEAWELPSGATVGLVHTLDLTDDVAARWGQVLGDYEILQPFRQIGREVYAVSWAEKEALVLRRFVGMKVHAGKILGLVARGWVRGAPQDAGIVSWVEKPLPGTGHVARLEFLPGFPVMDLTEFEEQEIHSLTLEEPGVWTEGGALAFGALEPILFSELVRELEMLWA